MTAVREMRHCAGCGTRLARDNSGERCSACARTARDLRDVPPELPREFWYTDWMRDVFRTRHMGKVIDAYQHHPYHGRQLSQAEIAEWLGISQPAISRMVRSADPPKDLPKLISYAQVLGMPAELLWFKLPDEAQGETAPSAGLARGIGQAGALIPRGAGAYARDQVLLIAPERDEPVDRREFLTASAGVGAGALTAASLLGLLATPERAAVPAEVRLPDIGQVRSAARFFQGWSNANGGGIVREAVITQLRWSAELLEARCPESLRPELFAAVGDLSGVCGHMAFDSCSHDDARRMLAFGLSCAEEAGDWHLRARMLAIMALQSLWCGNPDTALTHTEMALVRPDRLAASEIALLHTRRARALARLCRPQDALRSIGQADDAFGNRQQAEDPSWMSFYAEAEHAAGTGAALLDIAAQGISIGDPAQRLRAAIASYEEAHVRARALNGSHLASRLLVHGDPYEGIAAGNQALDDARGIRSLRVADHLRKLRGAAGQHHAITEARELEQRVTELVGAA